VRDKELALELQIGRRADLRRGAADNKKNLQSGQGNDQVKKFGRWSRWTFWKPAITRGRRFSALGQTFKQRTGISH